MRRPSAAVADRNAPILERIERIKADHPFWGYRRVWAHLRYVDGLDVNPKRVYRLMRLHGLTVPPHHQLKATRTTNRPKPRPACPNQWWGIDLTKVMTDTGWVYVVVVLDWHTKQIVGHYAGTRATAHHWLLALDRGLNRQFPDGVRGHGLHLMSDNGSQPTSLRFLQACSHLGIKQAFTSYNNPKGNADTERMMRTLKEELFWLREWSSGDELVDALNRWVAWYNDNYLHSALGYRTPNQAEETYNLSHKTLLQIAG
jgi:putative transposase